MSRTATGERRVVVVTGGGGGIGAAIAAELGRRGDLVVTVDPLVTLDGWQALPGEEDTTADRIVAAGGAAVASSVSVTDGPAVTALFAQLVHEHGRLDAVVNVAGISRPTSFAAGTEEDWRAVVDVHLGGYLNVLHAALPIMAAAGRGRIVGVTSGSGWRAADTGAYGCAKRAVAALTWQIGRVAPPGVTVNALSPIAVTRMVTEAIARASGTPSAASAGRGPATGGGSATGGLSLGSMPEPDRLGPIGAHLAGDGRPWLRGQVVFAAGSEVALVDPPRLLEVVGVSGSSPLAGRLDAATTAVVGPAEERQASTGGSNPRLTETPSESDGAAGLPLGGTATCAVVADRSDVLAAITAAMEARGVRCAPALLIGGRGDDGRSGSTAPVGRSFERAADLLAGAAAAVGPLDAVVLAVGGSAPTGRTSASAWEEVLATHEGSADTIVDDAARVRAVADVASAESRPMRLVTLVDARTSGGRSRAQAAAQLSRSARRATGEQVLAFAVGVEGADLAAAPIAELAAHLACSPGASALSGAELVASDGWWGLRSHPRPAGSVSFDGPEVPPWFDEVLRRVVEGDVAGTVAS